MLPHMMMKRSLLPVDSDEEWSMIEEVIGAFVNDEENE